MSQEYAIIDAMNNQRLLFAAVAALAACAACAENIVDVRADECGVLAGDNAIRAFAKVKDRIDAVRAADTGNVVRLFPFSLGDPATSNRNANANRAIHFFTYKETRTRWFDEKAKLPFHGPGLCPKTYSKRGDVFWWADRAREKQAEIDALGGDCEIVLLGDSITHDWEREPGRPQWPYFKKAYKALNLGYGGDSIENVLWRARYGELDGYKAKCVMLMAGANNRTTPAEQMADGIGEIIKVIREKQPQAKILLVGITPRGKTAADAANQKNIRTNYAAKQLANGQSIVWLDVGEKFLGPDKNLKPGLTGDNLHPNEAGYRVFLDAIRPAVGELLK